jgi:hypothetical protein
MPLDPRPVSGSTVMLTRRESAEYTILCIYWTGRYGKSHHAMASSVPSLMYIRHVAIDLLFAFLVVLAGFLLKSEDIK